jgi:putative CRISPR-associated protein (TIGR02619 family)
MSKALFVTVGTSVLSSPCLERGRGHLDTRAREFLRHDLPTKQRLATDGFVRELIEAHALCRPEKDYARLPRPTSAEMTSTHLLFQPETDFPGPFLHDKEHKIILLASDTLEGILCARVNAALMRKLFFACTCSPETCVSVEVRVVKGLEAEQKDGPTHTRDNIAEIMRPHAQFNRFFNITGGFKGAIPAISTLCATDFVPCPMFYQHESVNSAVRIDFTILNDGVRYKECHIVYKQFKGVVAGPKP